MKSAIIITPTTGAPELYDAAFSVATQTYDNLDYLVVTDGPAYAANVDAVMEPFNRDYLHKMTLPFNTGANGFYGHRIFAAVSHLVDHDYVFLLDQDNWFHPSHVESLIAACENNNLDWAYSLRKIYNKDKQYLCDDNCESLGKWPIAGSSDHLVDTSAYCFSNRFFREVGHLWHAGWRADRKFFKSVKDMPNRFACSGLHTLNYRLGGNSGSVTRKFFDTGNLITMSKHQFPYPWHVDNS